MDKLTARQNRAILALLSERDTASAAAKAGVSRETIYKWLKQPAFRAALAAAEAEALDSLSRALVALGSQATETLESVMSTPAAPAGVRVRAADVVLARLLQLRELSQLEARVSALEQKLDGRSMRQGGRLNNDVQ